MNDLTGPLPIIPTLNKSCPINEKPASLLNTKSADGMQMTNFILDIIQGGPIYKYGICFLLFYLSESAYSKLLSPT